MIRQKGEGVRVLGEGRKWGGSILIQTESNLQVEFLVQINALPNTAVQTTRSY